MPLSATHRHALHDAIAPLAGEEATEAMLAEFPASENDELVTKDFLRAELAELRAELKGDTAGLRTELKKEIAELRTEVGSRLVSQTRWTATMMLTGMAVSATIASLIS